MFDHIGKTAGVEGVTIIHVLARSSADQ